MTASNDKVLVVEDEPSLIETLDYTLRRQGYDVITATDGRKALELARIQRPDLIILDIMLPGLDGFEVCRIVRQEMNVPILMLTARTEEVDKVVGLEMGADDYMTKPFSLDEFEARVRALLRRADLPAASVVEIGPMHIDLTGRRLKIHGNPVELTTREWALLCLFLRHPERVLSKDEIIEEMCNQNEHVAPNTVEVYVSRLRAKIEPAGVRLRTVRGFGYLWNNRPDGG